MNQLSPHLVSSISAELVQQEKVLRPRVSRPLKWGNNIGNPIITDMFVDYISSQCSHMDASNAPRT